jgi:hypothetical protein
MADWEWPAANDEPVFDGTYIGAHPTRYNWEPDVEQLARSWVDYYGYESGSCWANTYVDHPPGWGRDTTSVDFWGYDRGFRIAYEVGQEIVDWIFNDPNPPWIEWIIWQGWWWVDDGMGWRIYPDFDLASDAQHINHVHVTFY